MKSKLYKALKIFIGMLFIIGAAFIIILNIQMKIEANKEKARNIQLAKEIATQKGYYKANQYIIFDGKLEMLLEHIDVANISDDEKVILMYFRVKNIGNTRYDLSTIKHSCYKLDGVQSKDISDYYEDSKLDYVELPKRKKCNIIMEYSYHGDGEYVLVLEQSGGEDIKVQIDVKA
jgi:hypothetical protein